MGSGTNNVGTYNLSAGSLSAANIQIRGGGGLAQTGGTLTATSIDQNGGSANFSGPAATLALDNSGTHLKTYSLAGGSVTAGAVAINTGGQFTVSGGSLNTGTLSVSGGAFNWTGGALNLSASGITIGAFGPSWPYSRPGEQQNPHHLRRHYHCLRRHPIHHRRLRHRSHPQCPVRRHP